MDRETRLSFEQKKVLILSSLGGVLEFYDFIIYIFLASVLEKVFFAGGSEFVATLKTFAVFSVGYFIRPLGGIVFAHFGDRYGRKVVFFLTVLLMALPSFAIAALPTQAQIGALAPVLLLLLRLLQGLAIGGEIPASITFVSEHIHEKQRGFATAILFFGVNMGLLLGSFITTLLNTYLSANEILAYGWRIPFLIGGIFGVLAIFLRRYLKETAAFLALRDQEKHRLPIMVVLRSSWGKVVQAFFIVALGSLTVFFYLYWPSYLTKTMHFKPATILTINTCGTFILSLSIMMSGLLGDRLGLRRIFEFGSGAIVIAAYPLFLLFGHQEIALVVINYFIFSLIFGMITGTFPAIVSSLFETSVRYSGIAISYNLAYAVFGGISPLICTVMIYGFDSPYAPAFYLSFVAFAALLACILGRRRYNTAIPAVEREEIPVTAK